MIFTFAGDPKILRGTPSAEDLDILTRLKASPDGLDLLAKSVEASLRTFAAKFDAEDETKWEAFGKRVKKLTLPKRDVVITNVDNAVKAQE